MLKKEAVLEQDSLEVRRKRFNRFAWVWIFVQTMVIVPAAIIAKLYWLRSWEWFFVGVVGFVVWIIGLNIMKLFDPDPQDDWE